MKTAGTSLEIALSRICGPDDIITPISKTDEANRKALGYTGKQNYQFPLSDYSVKDLLLSLYKRKRLSYYNHISAAEIRKRIPADIWNGYFKFCFERNPYDKFVSWYYWNGGEQAYPTMIDFIQSGVADQLKGFELYTIDGLPAVDKIYKFEELSSAINDINSRLNLNEKIELPAVKSKGNIRKSFTSYRDILTKNETNWISKRFAREIAYFDYAY